jgi:hypothetical protein
MIHVHDPDTCAERPRKALELSLWTCQEPSYHCWRIQWLRIFSPIGIANGFALLWIIRGKDGPRFLRTSSWLIVYPVLPLMAFTIDIAQLIRRLQ